PAVGERIESQAFIDATRICIGWEPRNSHKHEQDCCDSNEVEFRTLPAKGELRCHWTYAFLVHATPRPFAANLRIHCNRVCPKWVTTGHDAGQITMSAIPPKADIRPR